MDTFYIGSELKFLFEITAAGFDQDGDDYSIVLKCADEEKDYDDDDIFTDENTGKHYLLVDTSYFNAGVLTATVTAQVADSAFGSGYRKEVVVVELCHLRETP